MHFRTPRVVKMGEAHPPLTAGGVRNRVSTEVGGEGGLGQGNSCHSAPTSAPQQFCKSHTQTVSRH